MDKPSWVIGGSVSGGSARAAGLELEVGAPESANRWVCSLGEVLLAADGPTDSFYGHDCGIS